MADEAETIRIPVAQPLQHETGLSPTPESDDLSDEEPAPKKLRTEDSDYSSGAYGRPWTPAEDDVLLRERGQDMGWTAISQQLDRRSGDACRTRYNRLVMLGAQTTSKAATSRSTNASPAPHHTSTTTRTASDRHSTGTTTAYPNAQAFFNNGLNSNSTSTTSNTNNPKKDQYVQLMVDSTLCKARMTQLDTSIDADRAKIRELEAQITRKQKQKTDEKRQYDRVVAKADVILQSLTAEAQNGRVNGR